MSRSQQMFDYMSQLQPGAEDYVPLDPTRMAEDLKMDRVKMVSQLSTWNSIGRVELVKDGSHGRTSKIIGFRNLRGPGKPGPKAKKAGQPKVVAEERQPEPRPIRRLVQTPELDRIMSARSAMEEFVSQFPGIVDEARAKQAITIDPEKAEAYVNEGLNILQRNERLEAHNRELRARVNELERELGYKRTANNKELRQALVTAGVIHSDPND